MKNTIYFWNQQAEKFNKADQSEIKTLVGMSQKYLKESDVILDFGCAAGYSSLYMAKNVRSVIGVDYSSEMIRLARENTRAKGIDNVSFVVTDLNDENAPDVTFNGVLAYNVLHLVDDLEKTLMNMHKMVEEDGVLITYTPCLGEGNIFVRSLTAVLAKVGNFPVARKLTGTDMKKMFESAGFEIIDFIGYKDPAHSHFIVAKKKL